MNGMKRRHIMDVEDEIKNLMLAVGAIAEMNWVFIQQALPLDLQSNRH